MSLVLYLLLSDDLIIRSSFRELPSFRVDTIRKFSSNPSEMEKLAARDFENLLQVFQHSIFKAIDGLSRK